VFTRGVALKLLAPTVLVSLALVGACLFGTLYLSRLHVNVSEFLTESVQSVQAAAQLEAAAKELLRLFRTESHLSDFAQKVRRQNGVAEVNLNEAFTLANLPQERQLVNEINSGLRDYLRRWDDRTRARPDEIPSYDNDLAERLDQNVLAPSIRLRKYNTDQVEEADGENRTIVHNLTWVLLAVGLGAPVSGLLLGYAMARRLHQSIYQLSVRIRDAAGRLNSELKPISLDEIGDFPDLHVQLHSVIQEIERVVTELHQREREVLRAEQLAAVGQVAAGVAHEIRNPLTSVKMLVQTGLEGTPPSGLPPEDLAVMETEIRRMEQCIQMFLDFARPPRAERRSTNLVEVIRRSMALVEGRARRQKIALEAHVPDEAVLLMIDPEQIHQVLVNLLINAIDALPRGGTVSIDIQREEEAQHGQKSDGESVVLGSVQVRIHDTGSGIASAIRNRLFEPFVTSKESGLGLGLSICKRLIEAHGGTIQGDNATEGGAVFTFTLPLEEPSHARAVGCG